MQQLTHLLTNPEPAEKANQRLQAYFFKPYHNPKAFIAGLTSPVSAVMEESLPNLVLSALLMGHAALETLSALSHLLLAQGSHAMHDFEEVGLSVFKASIAIALVVLVPFFEAIRFFARWGSTLMNGMACETSENDCNHGLILN